jgi:hypothetical protein
MQQAPIRFGKSLPEPGYRGQRERFAFRVYMSYTYELTMI